MAVNKKCWFLQIYNNQLKIQRKQQRLSIQILLCNYFVNSCISVLLYVDTVDHHVPLNCLILQNT